MLIAGLAAATSAYAAINRLPASRQKAEATTANNSERITLSAQGKQLASQTQAQGADTAGIRDEKGYPVEYYAVPAWLVDMSAYIEVTGDLGAKGDDLYGKNKHLVGKFEQERQEYQDLLGGHFQALMAKEGIDTPQKHYEAIIADKGNSERIHQLMLEKVHGDGRMKELASILGIDV